MTDPERDDVFESYLQRRPVLPAPDDRLEPPVALDQKVLAEAREAVSGGADDGSGAAGSARRPPNRPPRWAVPIALAATILLCLSIVINVSLNTNRSSPNRDRMAEARADVKASAQANASAESEAAAGIAARANSSALAFGKDERRESVPGEIPSNEVVLPGAKVAGAAAPRVPVEAEPAASVSAERPASGEQPAPAAPATSLSAAAAPLQPASAQPAPGPASAPALAARAPAEQAPQAEVSAGLAKWSGATAADSRVSRSASAEEKAALFAKQAGAGTPHPNDPKVWLQQIDALRAAGKTEEAAAEMRRFKAAFPGYAVRRAPHAPSSLPK